MGADAGADRKHTTSTQALARRTHGEGDRRDREPALLLVQNRTDGGLRTARGRLANTARADGRGAPRWLGGGSVARLEGGETVPRCCSVGCL
jgi:hypothetical protein